jgi:hypothetical protein
MTKVRDLVFALTFGLLLTHELDAVRCFEWRILPITSWMPENIGMAVFIFAHVPLFAWLAGVCWNANQARQLLARQLFCGFAILHVGLHWLFRNDPAYAFQGWLSNGLIIGAGIVGAIFLLLTAQPKEAS